jgi:hypothetical protein
VDSARAPCSGNHRTRSPRFVMPRRARVVPHVDERPAVAGEHDSAPAKAFRSWGERSVVRHSDNDASRADPARASRESPSARESPQPTGRDACSRRESPPIPAQAGSAKTGLSGRRSRVRVPSLPSLFAGILLGRGRRPGSDPPRSTPNDHGLWRELPKIDATPDETRIFHARQDVTAGRPAHPRQALPPSDLFGVSGRQLLARLGLPSRGEARSRPACA